MKPGARWWLAWIAALPCAALAQLSPMPPVPPPAAFERELIEGRVLVRRIVVEGVRSIPEDAVRAVAGEYAGRALGESDMREIERRFTQLYLDRGFATSGVLLSRRPDPGGDALFTAVEGTVAQVRFRTPPRYASAGWLTSLLVPRPEAPIRIADLQERMTALRDAGIVERINADLAPLPALGASELVVAVEERRPWSVEARYDNHHSPVVGARRPSLWAEHRNVSGWGDRFDAHIGRTEGLEDLHAQYSVGLPRSAWRFGARYERSDSLAIDPPAFRDLEITTDATTRRLEVSNGLIGNPAPALSASLAFERRDSKSMLLGLPFSFIPGLPEGVTEIDVARLAAEFSALGTEAVLFLRVQWSEGRSRIAVERVELAPEERFRAFAAQAQYARRTTQAGAQLLLRMDGQYAPQALFPIEKKAVGGAESVRGYRENVLLGDSAVVGTVEGRWPAWKAEGASVTLAAFADGGWVRNHAERATSGPTTIASIGVGAAFTLPWGFSGRVDYARPNRRWLTDNEDSQDRGLHFRISWTLP